MYIVKTFEEALETMQESAREQFGDDFNVSNTSNWYRLIGLPVSLLCVEKSQNIKDLEDRMNIYKATGTDLDDILSNFRFSRKQSSAATGTWTTSNSTPNTVVSIGALTVERATDGISYKNINQVTISSLGVGIFEIECETSGIIGNCDIGAIDKIKTPVAIIFEDKSCIQCDHFHNKILTNKDVIDEFLKFTVIRVDANSTKELILPTGEKTTPKSLVEKINLDYRPAVLLYDDKKLISTIDALLFPFHFKEVLRYVSGKHYVEFPKTYLDYLRVRQDELLKQGIDINVAE